jgi:DNA repair protein RecN (Recombination protein N)
VPIFPRGKKIVGDRTVTVVNKLAAEARLQELARMLGGALITDTTLAHAQEMLTTARQGAELPGRPS